MTSRVILLPDQDRDLGEVIQGLRDMERDGVLMGLVYGLYLRGARYYFDTAGLPRRNPVIGIGLAGMLFSELERRVRHQATDTMF